MTLENIASRKIHEDIMSSALDLVVEIQKFTPWTISVLVNRARTVIVVLPNLTINVIPGIMSDDYELYVNGECQVRYGKKNKASMISSIKDIIQGEVDRIQNNDSIKRVENLVIKLLSEIGNLRGNIQILEKKVDNIKSENRQLRKKLDNIELGLECHPNGVQAHLLKEEFEKLASDSKVPSNND